MSELEDFEKEPTVESESSDLPRWPYWVGALVLGRRHRGGCDAQEPT